MVATDTGHGLILHGSPGQIAPPDLERLHSSLSAQTVKCWVLDLEIRKVGWEGGDQGPRLFGTRREDRTQEGLDHLRAHAGPVVPRQHASSQGDRLLQGSGIGQGGPDVRVKCPGRQKRGDRVLVAPSTQPDGRWVSRMQEREVPLERHDVIRASPGSIIDHRLNGRVHGVLRPPALSLPLLRMTWSARPRFFNGRSRGWRFSRYKQSRSCSQQILKGQLRKGWQYLEDIAECRSHGIGVASVPGRA